MDFFCLYGTTCVSLYKLRIEFTKENKNGSFLCTLTKNMWYMSVCSIYSFFIFSNLSSQYKSICLSNHVQLESVFSFKLLISPNQRKAWNHVNEPIIDTLWIIAINQSAICLEPCPSANQLSALNNLYQPISVKLGNMSLCQSAVSFEQSLSTNQR